MKKALLLSERGGGRWFSVVVLFYWLNLGLEGVRKMSGFDVEQKAEIGDS